MTCFLVNPGNFAAVVPGLGPARAGLHSTWSGAEKYNNWVLKGDQWLLLYIFVYQLGSWNLMNRIGISNSNLEYESIYIYIYGYFLLFIYSSRSLWWSANSSTGETMIRTMGLSIYPLVIVVYLFWLVVWNMNFIFPMLLKWWSNLSFIFFRGVETTNQS